MRTCDSLVRDRTFGRFRIPQNFLIAAPPEEHIQVLTGLPLRVGTPRKSSEQIENLILFPTLSSMLAESACIAAVIVWSAPQETLGATESVS